MNRNKSADLFASCKNVIPGGVNSPVRAFKAVGGQPIFIQHADGAYLYDVDGNTYIDLIGSWGPMILGHRFEAVEHAIIDAVKGSTSFGAPGTRELEMAELICAMIPSVEMVRMVNSGTEACMAAIRVARGYTGRDKIIKFEGCYHGHSDSFLISAGSGALTMGNPDSAGVTQGVANDTLTAPFNDLKAVEDLIFANNGQIAAIIVEPVVGNMGCVLPKTGFLAGLRALTQAHGIVLIFDEVMTGFRLSSGGAQKLLNIEPDLTTLGKIIGGGLPVGAYGGKKEIMQHVSPVGKVYQAGTLSGNPVAMAAGLALLSYLRSHQEIYAQLDHNTTQLALQMQTIAHNKGFKTSVNHIGSMFTLFFTESKVVDYNTAKSSDTTLFGAYFNAMLDQGIYMAPSQFESMFVSSKITEKEMGLILDAHAKALDQLAQKVH